MDENETLINRILKRELDMFLTVPTLQKASCQEDPEMFRIVRSSQFVSWSMETLESYLQDLKSAEKNKINLMTKKYARMDNLINKIKENPAMDEIVDIEIEWQKEMFEKFPCLMSSARALRSSEDTPSATSFETYLRGELETYSDTTLTFLLKDVKNYFEKNENMMMKNYLDMVKQLGYTSIEDAEETKRKEMSAAVS
ncbi:hypothetical protein BuS5_01894 [Desulfosarcina sp. BuS5]|uniref:DUF4125 family protein n=1 Tax=Desulfosarcina sp. BuS5 TaxID=933262 RepID=UPI000487B659|nr:DUF4125 family protein [Desulfosarcina sp. BuS5]WDN88926.1 hypothetical protein BuS5_01894 [Desulfosarcina sp. BuS5]